MSKYEKSYLIICDKINKEIKKFMEFYVYFKIMMKNHKKI